ALAFLVRPAGRAGPADSLGRPRGAAAGPAVMLILAGLGVAASFAPAWDSFTLRTAAGQTQTLRVGDAFAGTNPALLITPDERGRGHHGGRAGVAGAGGDGPPGRVRAPGRARRRPARGGRRPDGGPGHLGPRAGGPARLARPVRHLERAGLRARAHDRLGPH